MSVETDHPEDGMKNAGSGETYSDIKTPPHVVAGTLAALLGAKSAGVHEIGVQGSVIEQTKKFLEENMVVQPVDLTGPGVEDPVPAYLTGEGVVVIGPEEFDKWATKPRFRKGTARLTDLSSFITHTNRYKDEHTLVFANDDRANPSLTAVLNYNEAGATGEPRFGNHRSHFAFPLSDEWKAWKSMNAEPMQMSGFARFLEDHIIDVMPINLIDVSDDDGTQRFVDTLGGLGRIADPAQLMSLASNLHINENSVVSQAQVLSSGEVKLDFQSSHDATQNGQSITMPTMFAIGIPVFKNGPAYRIFARLRYRKQGSALSFWYELWRDDRTFDKAFDESVARVQDETGLTVLMGTDEGA